MTKDYAQTNNERLEYLGDAVLGTIVAEYLFKKYPNGDEGFLTKMRSKIVKRKSLNYIGDQMGLDVLLAEYNRTRLSSSMLGNAVEALVGAVYLEKGYRATKRFVIQRMLKLYVDMHELETVDDNYKSQLLEYCQKNGMQVSYKLLNKFKQDRRDRFKVAVIVNGEQLSLADDFNKKSAEQLASLRALQKLGLIDKTAPRETGRKSPSKESKKVDRKPSRAKQERKPNRTDSSKNKVKPAPTDQKLALKAKQQTEKATRSKLDKSKVEPVKSKKANPRKAEPAITQSNAAMPARKLRRNNSRLGRAIWNGTQTSGASIDIVNKLGYFESPELIKETKRAQEKKRASAKTRHAKTVVGNTTFVKRKDVKKAKPKVDSKPPSTRKRRPIPLRLLTPIVKDASAVMAIDFDLLLETTSSTKVKKAKPTARRKKPTPKKKVVTGKTEIEALKEWEETPLGLSIEKNPTPKAISNGKKKPSIRKQKSVVTEQIDQWEDTLLEVTPDNGELAGDLPEMYTTSDAKAPVRRKKPQRRKANRKKKTEE